MDKRLLEITILMGLDEASNNALNNLVKACNFLHKQFNIKILINPINLWCDSISSTIRGLPIIVIGGKKVLSGYSPKVDELVKEILNTIKSGKDIATEDLLPHIYFKEGLLNAAIAD
jgi:hypothetical protein